MIRSSGGAEEYFESDGISVTIGDENKLDKAINEDIITSRVIPSQAFEIFAGKLLTYDSSLYTHEKGVELPWQKLSRIKFELAQLQSDLDHQIEFSGKNDRDATIWSVLRDESNQLQSVQSLIETHPGLKALDSKKIGTIDLTKEIQEFKTRGFMNSETTPKVSVLTDFTALEKRVEKLERVLGNQSNVLDVDLISTLNKSSGSTPLSVLETLHRLEQRMSLIDNASIDALKGKLGALRLELETTKAKSSSDSKLMELYKKVEDVFSWIQKVELVADELPNLVIRLNSINKSNSVLIDASTRITSLQETVSSLTMNCNANQDLLQTLRAGMESNLMRMEENIKKIDNKIATRLGK